MPRAGWTGQDGRGRVRSGRAGGGGGVVRGAGGQQAAERVASGGSGERRAKASVDAQCSVARHSSERRQTAQGGVGVAGEGSHRSMVFLAAIFAGAECLAAVQRRLRYYIYNASE